MNGFHNLEYHCGFIAANSADSSLSSSWRENSLLQVFAVANRGFVARGHRLAWIFAAGVPRADKYRRSVERVGVVDLREVVSHRYDPQGRRSAGQRLGRLTQSIPARELYCSRPATLEPRNRNGPGAYPSR